MDNQTAYWFLSTIVQAMAAIWAIFFGITIAARSWMEKVIEKSSFPVRFHLWEKTSLITINIVIGASIMIGIFALAYFPNKYLTAFSALFAVFGIFFLGIYLSYMLYKL